MEGACSFGWKKIGDELHPLPTTQDPTPKSLIDIPQCGCSKSKCINKRCYCKSKNQYCSDICTCVGCENRTPEGDNVHNLNDGDNLELDDTTEDEEKSDDEEYSNDDSHDSD